jgi:hypothetical protein
MNLFNYGLDLSNEPNLWDVFPIINLRIYTGTRYFATWDYGPCFGLLHHMWPKPPNPECHWDFNPSFYDFAESLYYEVKLCN